MIYALDWGIEGAAIATVISLGVNMALYIGNRISCPQRHQHRVEEYHNPCDNDRSYKNAGKKSGGGGSIGFCVISLSNTLGT